VAVTDQSVRRTAVQWTRLIKSHQHGRR